jgi:hypothetical protein
MKETCSKFEQVSSFILPQANYHSAKRIIILPQADYHSAAGRLSFRRRRITILAKRDNHSAEGGQHR